MIDVGSIREQLFRYLAREITLNDFEDWIVGKSWNMHQDSPDDAQRLVGAIELRFGEYSDGHLTDEGLERELVGLFSPSVQIFIDDARPTKRYWTARATNEPVSVELQAS
jgi:hypothetical protein